MHRTSLSANGLRFSALSQGDGPVVLCLHGFPDNHHSFHQQLPALAGAGFRALAPMLRGYEPSSQPPDRDYHVVRMAEDVVETQGALRAEVHIRAQSPITKVTPVTKRPTEQLYTLVGIAAATRARTRLLVGVEVNGLTVCPCAQDMVREHSVETLVEEGYAEQEAERIVGLLPMASHNQRGRGTLLMGSDQRLRAEDLLRIAEQSMSSEIYELLKRPDELAVVEKAHRNPRFVEDLVRGVAGRLAADPRHVARIGRARDGPHPDQVLRLRRADHGHRENSLPSGHHRTYCRAALQGSPPSGRPPA